MWIYKAHNVNTQAESEARAVARWGWGAVKWKAKETQTFWAAFLKCDK